MAFTIQLYHNNSEPERIGKSLSATQSFTGSLKDQTSIINPSILVKSAGVPQGNYARIDAFGRYYFITDIVSVRNELWEIKMHVDVLQTYASQIRACGALISRQEYSFNSYLKDDLVPLSNDNRQYIYKFDNGKEFNINNIILAVNAGAVKEG